MTAATILFLLTIMTPNGLAAGEESALLRETNLEQTMELPQSLRECPEYLQASCLALYEEASDRALVEDWTLYRWMWMRWRLATLVGRIQRTAPEGSRACRESWITTLVNYMREGPAATDHLLWLLHPRVQDHDVLPNGHRVVIDSAFVPGRCTELTIDQVRTAMRVNTIGILDEQGIPLFEAQDVGHLLLSVDAELSAVPGRTPSQGMVLASEPLPKQQVLQVTIRGNSGSLTLGFNLTTP